MISQPQKTSTVETNFDQGSATDMSLDASATEHLIGLLTNLYTDPEAACIREYSTNALDAHREIGQKRPIEVSTPTSLAPFFTVRDFGVGLSVDDLHNIYAKYGRSTKRDTNDQVGMLGLGCKSALTYTDQFTLVAVKDGVRAQVSIALGENGVGRLQVLDTSATDEHAGVTVIIPVKSYNHFETKARAFFRFWEPGTVLLNGSQPKPLDGLNVSDTLTVVEGENNDWIVMGNVAYPTEFSAGLPWRTRLVKRVPIGSVLPAPSREGLRDTAGLKAIQAAVKTEFKTGISKAIEEDVDAQPHATDALVAYMTWRKRVPSWAVPPLVYKGTTIPDRYTPGTDMVIVDVNSYKQSASSTIQHLLTEYLPTTLFVHGYTDASFTATKKKKLLQYMDENGISASKFALVQSPPSLPWVQKSMIVPWADVAAIKLPTKTRTYTSSGRIPGSYDFFTLTGHFDGTPGDKIDQTSPIYYYVGRYHEASNYVMALRGEGKPFTLVYFGSNREAKFARDVPQSQRVVDVIKAKAEAWEKSLPADKVAALEYQESSSYAGCLHGIDASKFDDPDVREAIKLANVDVDAIRTARNAYDRLTGRYRTRKSASIKDPFRHYPLISYYNFRQEPLAEIVIYMNAKYATMVAGKNAQKA